MRSDTIVAYAYQAETLCPKCVLLKLGIFNEIRGTSIEQELNNLAALDGIDRQDERSFDSGDFPKVVFADQVQWHHAESTDMMPSNQVVMCERCDSCGEELL